MEELSFLDKIKVLFDNILAHPLFTLLFLVPIILFFLQKKHGKKVYVIVYFLTILTVLFAFGDVIFDLFDNFMDGLFMVLYFPNFITLFIVVMLSSLIALVSLFSTNMYVVNKIVNYLSFGIIQVLFTLILLTVRVNEINIYKDNALYINSDVLTLMQFLIGTFAFQIITILIINLINKVTDMLDKKSGKISDSLDKQVSNLKNTKRLIKNVTIDNEKVGFINVADKSSTSRPKLKPFKFDIEKIESIMLQEDIKPKLFKMITLDDKNVSYLNEIIKPRKFKFIELDSNKIKSIELNQVNTKEKLFNKISLDDKDFTYLNEIIKPRKFKFIELDSNKIKSIELNQVNTKEKLFNKISLDDKDFTYLNEIIKPRKFKFIELDSNKIKSIELNQVNTKEKLFSKISLDDKDFTYLNEIVKPRKFKFIELDSNKIKSIELSPSIDKAKLRLIPTLLDTSKMAYVTQNKKQNKYINDFDHIMKIKPDLMKPMDSNLRTIKTNVLKPTIYRAHRHSKSANDSIYRKLVCNLNIIDIQSTLDVISKYHLIKNVRLKGYDNVLTVDNLKISNLKLLFDVLKIYKLYK